MQLTAHIHNNNSITPAVEISLQSLSLTNSCIPIYFGGKKHLLPINDLMMIVAVRNYSMVHLKNGEKILSSKTLKYWQDTINDPVNLLRIHRSYLIHRSVILYFNSIKGSFNLVNGMEIMGSRRHVKILKDKM